MEIAYIDRESGLKRKELVYGEKAVSFLYSNYLGRHLSKVLANPLISKIYGCVQDGALSKRKIKPFIKDFFDQKNQTFSNDPFLHLNWSA